MSGQDTNIQDYKSSLEDPGSRKHGTFSYLPPASAQKLRGLVDYIIAQGWNPAVEHVEDAHASKGYWYMWKLPLFGEKNAETVLAELEACQKAYPEHLVRLIGYDNKAQSLGTSMVVNRRN